MDLSPFENIEPQELRWNDDGGVRISWSDGHDSDYDLAHLRAECPCATCKGTHGPPTTLVIKTGRAGFNIASTKRKSEPSIEVKSVAPVGKYAIRFTWGDGHDAGLYSYRYLRGICPCPNCAGSPTAQA